MLCSRDRSTLIILIQQLHWSLLEPEQTRAPLLRWGALWVLSSSFILKNGLLPFLLLIFHSTVNIFLSVLLPQFFFKLCCAASSHSFPSFSKMECYLFSWYSPGTFIYLKKYLLACHSCEATLKSLHSSIAEFYCAFNYLFLTQTAGIHASCVDILSHFFHWMSQVLP